MPDLYGPYLEKVSGRSPCTVSFPRRGAGRGVFKWLIGNDGTGQYSSITAATQIWDCIKELGGFTQEHNDGIRLERTLPKAHPVYPWLFVEDITSIEPQGRFTKVPADPGGILEAPTMESAAFYPCYEISVSMTSRPYALAQDWNIETDTLTWNKIDGSATAGVNYAKEWLRYTDVERIAQGEYITAQAGQFVFDVASGLSPNALPAGSGQLRMFIPKPAIKMTWHEVPYSYVDTIGTLNYFEEGLGCINQYEWMGYGAGTMLFHAVAINRYTTWVPNVTAWEGTRLIFSAAKLCDISMIFLFLDPPLGKDSAGAAGTPSAPVNANVIQAGHNRVPYAHRNSWYFAKTVGVSGFSDSQNRGIYPSFPMELLFTNPGA